MSKSVQPFHHTVQIHQLNKIIVRMLKQGNGFNCHLWTLNNTPIVLFFLSNISFDMLRADIMKSNANSGSATTVNANFVSNEGQL